MCVVEFASDEFKSFYSILGERVKLKGWENFRGGLDSKSKFEYNLFLTFYSHTLYNV